MIVDIQHKILICGVIETLHQQVIAENLNGAETAACHYMQQLTGNHEYISRRMFIDGKILNR